MIYRFIWSFFRCGDLNVAHQTIDLTNPKTNTKNAGFTKEEREDFSSILADGFIDSCKFLVILLFSSVCRTSFYLVRYLYPDERDAFTFWAYFRNARARNIGWRLDYFLLSSSLRENLCDFVIQTGVFGSDHCPIVLLMSLWRIFLCWIGNERFSRQIIFSLWSRWKWWIYTGKETLAEVRCSFVCDWLSVWAETNVHSFIHSSSVFCSIIFICMFREENLMLNEITCRV